MTDELTIQGVNPQMQQVQKKNNTVPYTLGGAAVGAAAGWGATALYKGSGSAKSYEELVKEANDKDKLELTSKKDAVEKAEKELAEASKAVYEGAEKTNYDNAVAAKDEAWKKLYDSKKKVLELGSGEFDIQNPDFKPYGETDFPIPKGMNHKKAEKEYNSLTSDVTKRVKELKKDMSATGKPQQLKDSTESTIEALFKNLETDYKMLTDDTLKNRFYQISYDDGGKDKYTDAYNKAFGVAKTQYPEVDIITLKNTKKEEILEIPGRIIAGEGHVPAGWDKADLVPVVNPTTKRIDYKTVYFDPNEATQYITKRNNEIRQLRKEYAQELLQNAQSYTTINQELKNLEKAIDNKTSLSDAEKLGSMYDKSTGVKVKEIVKEAKSKTYTQTVDGKILSGYSNDIAILENLDATKTKLPKKLNGSYAGAKNIGEALEMAKGRQKVAEEFLSEEKRLTGALKNTKSNNAVVKELDEKILKIYSGDEKLTEAMQKLRETFPDLKLGGDTLTTEQIEAQAKEFADKNLNKSFTEAVERTKGDLDKVIAEKGKVNETAKKTAQEAVEKAKGELEKLIADLNGKVKGMSGTAKALVIGGVAAAGALIGLSMSNKSKNV